MNIKNSSWKFILCGLHVQCNHQSVVQLLKREGYVRDHSAAHILCNFVKHLTSQSPELHYCHWSLRKQLQGFMSGLLGCHFYPHPWHAGYQWEITRGLKVLCRKSKVMFAVWWRTILNEPLCHKPVAVSWGSTHCSLWSKRGHGNPYCNI
jgi:hypothetical protein